MKLDYDEISPITKNECVIVEADESTNTTSYMCMESGFTTSDKLVIDSKHVSDYEATLPQLMKDVKYTDEERGLIWYPAFLNVPGVGMLYCSGNKESDFRWEVAKTVELIGDERKKFPVPGKLGEYYTSRLDTENATQFDRARFGEALDCYYEMMAKIYAQ